MKVTLVSNNSTSSNNRGDGAVVPSPCKASYITVKEFLKHTLNASSSRVSNFAK